MVFHKTNDIEADTKSTKLVKKQLEFYSRCSTPPATVTAKTPDFPMETCKYPDGFSSFHEVPVGLVALTPALLCIPPVGVTPQTCPPGPASSWVSLPSTGSHAVPMGTDWVWPCLK